MQGTYSYTEYMLAGTHFEHNGQMLTNENYYCNLSCSGNTACQFMFKKHPILRQW